MLAGICAVGILSVLLCFYDMLPVHIANQKGNTDYVFEANARWVKATEGISWGKFDANGYNNVTVVENPDILVLGSSHMEAVNVMQKENTAYLLGEKLKDNYTIYNMGVSGHNFFKVCQYLPANLELYEKTPKAVIVETSTVSIQKGEVEEVLASTVEYTPSHSTGVLGFLQKIPFFRSMYHQITGGLLDIFMTAASQTDTEADSVNPEEETLDLTAYAELFDYLSQMEKSYGTQIIIVYHPTGTLMEDGSLRFENSEQLAAFQSYAKKTEIDFVDMTSAFEKMYVKEHHVAHGFITGELEAGHVNRYGHRAMAEALFDKIKELEGVGELCR